MLFEVLIVPLFDSRVMLKILHSIETRHNWVLVCIFNQFYDLLGDKEDIGINCEPYIIVYLTVKWHLCCTPHDIETERLHSRERDKTRVLIHHDDFVALLCEGQECLWPIFEEITRKLTTGESYRDRLHLWD